MSQGAREKEPIYDMGKRLIQEIGGNGTRATSLPKRLRDTPFPTDLGDEVVVLYDPNTNEVRLTDPEE